MKIDVMGVRLDNFSKDALTKELKTAFNSKAQTRIGKVNTEFLLRAQTQPEFKKTINDFEINITDGSGVMWAAKYLSLALTRIPILRQIQAIWQMFYCALSLIFYPKYCESPIPARFPGVEAFYLMLEAAAGTKQPVFIFGAERRVLEKAVLEINKKLPKLILAGYHDGYDFTDETITAEIKKSGAKLLFVALGSPKQEYWIRDNISKLDSVKIAVGEGGSLDFVSGESSRAPKWMRESGLEWLWRAFANKDKTGTSRFARVWSAVPIFMVRVVKFKLDNEK